MKWNVVYFDDQAQNIECLSDLLESEFNFIGCCEPQNYEAFLDKQAHAILLDIHMPGLNGFDLYQKIVFHSSYNDCPIFFISGDITDENKVLSFENGAVDFFPRDMKWEEIRVRLINKIKLYLQVSQILEYGNLKVDLKNLKTTIAGRPIELTMLETRMLSTLIRSLPSGISRHEMIKKIWENENIKPGTINTHITNLRSKLEAWNYQIKIKHNNIFLTAN